MPSPCLYALVLVALATYRVECSMCRLYMVCNSLQGMDGLAGWGTGVCMGCLIVAWGMGRAWAM